MKITQQLCRCGTLCSLPLGVSDFDSAGTLPWWIGTLGSKILSELEVAYILSFEIHDSGLHIASGSSGLVFLRESGKEGWFASTRTRVYNLWWLEAKDIVQAWCLIGVNLLAHRFFLILTHPTDTEFLPYRSCSPEPKTYICWPELRSSLFISFLEIKKKSEKREDVRMGLFRGGPAASCHEFPLLAKFT